MSETFPNNPAERLLGLYQTAISQNLGTMVAKTVWAQLLDVPENDLPLLLKKIGQVAGLAHDVREQVKELKGLNPANLVTWIPKLLQPFKAYNLDSHFIHFLKPIDENVVSLLQICSDALSEQTPEPTVNRQQLKKLRGDLAEFVKSLSNINLPDDARAFLMKHVAIIDNALIDYQLQGFDSLTAGLERIVGHAVLNRKKIDKWSQESPEPFRKVRVLIAIYISIVAATQSTKKLLEDLHIVTLPALPLEHSGPNNGLESSISPAPPSNSEK
ncbi:MAG: hypothetical protein ACTHLN_14205 [Tepidisphaeraceae bacterium]